MGLGLTPAVMFRTLLKSACASCNGGTSVRLFPPQHEGHKRVYQSAEVIEITVIAELRRKGFSLQKIRRVLRFLQREMGKRLSEVLESDSDLHLVTDGKSIYLEDQQERIIDILKNAKQPMFLVCVSDQVRRLNDSPPQADEGRSHLSRIPAAQPVALKTTDLFAGFLQRRSRYPIQPVRLHPHQSSVGGTCRRLAPRASPTIMTINPTT